MDVIILANHPFKHSLAATLVGLVEHRCLEDTKWNGDTLCNGAGVMMTQFTKLGGLGANGFTGITRTQIIQ